MTAAEQRRVKLAELEQRLAELEARLASSGVRESDAIYQALKDNPSDPPSSSSKVKAIVAQRKRDQPLADGLRKEVEVLRRLVLEDEQAVRAAATAEAAKTRDKLRANVEAAHRAGFDAFVVLHEAWLADAVAQTEALQFSQMHPELGPLAAALPTDPAPGDFESFIAMCIRATFEAHKVGDLKQIVPLFRELAADRDWVDIEVAGHADVDLRKAQLRNQAQYAQVASGDFGATVPEGDELAAGDAAQAAAAVVTADLIAELIG